jgi:hypothetical protein
MVVRAVCGAVNIAAARSILPHFSGGRVKRDTSAMAAYRTEHPACEVCGWTRHVHVHHMLPMSCGGTNDPDNLVTLCANHHADAHAEMAQFVEVVSGERRFRSGHGYAGARLLVTRHGLIKHLRSIDRADVDMYQRQVRAVNNQIWAAMTPEQREDRIRLALSMPTPLSDAEHMMLYELRSGKARLVAA